MIELRGVERRFGDVSALRGVDLRVEPGERVVVLGHNGAGKTTLLKICAGLLRPTHGDVRVLGGSPDDPRVRARVGVLGHAPALYPRLTALENVTLWARLYGVPDARHRAAALLERLGLDPADRRAADAFSEGMRKRAGLARALVHGPDVLLLDEPFAGVDREGVGAAVDAVTQGGPTVLVATHEVDRVGGLASRAVRLEAGRLAVEAEVGGASRPQRRNAT